MSDLFEKLRSLSLPQIVGGMQESGGEWKRLCPFHAEKTPSFTVFEKNGSWHWKCFGCGKGGDAIDYVELLRGLSTMDAARAIAAEHGVEVAEARPKSPEEAETRSAAREAEERARAHRAELLRALDAAACYYQKALAMDRPEAARARVYLEARGLSAAVDPWGLGYAPDSDGIVQYLEQQGVGPDLRIEAGITGKGKTGMEYRRFRDRVMIPIRDRDGRTVSFAARLLPEGQ